MTTTHRSHAAQPSSPRPAAAVKAPRSIRQLDLNNLPPGINPKLATKVRGLNMANKWLKTGNTTFCNQAFNAYAHTFGYTGFDTKGGGTMIANLMNRKMSAPGSGFHKVDAQGAIDAAKAGKMVVASYHNDKPAKGRPDGLRPGHVAAVTGEWAPGVPGVSQAGTHNFEFGRWANPHAPTYFVKD
jgi:hypothetical protein